MSATNILQQIGESLVSTATVKSVFGEPIQMKGKTVVPVAKVAYGFGGGFGSGHKGGDGKAGPESEGSGEGGGGGGGVRAIPAGVLEITAESTRFVPFPNPPLLLSAFAAGLAVGAFLVGRRLSRGR